MQYYISHCYQQFPSCKALSDAKITILKTFNSDKCLFHLFSLVLSLSQCSSLQMYGKNCSWQFSPYGYYSNAIYGFSLHLWICAGKKWVLPIEISEIFHCYRNHESSTILNHHDLQRIPSNNNIRNFHSIGWAVRLQGDHILEQKELFFMILFIYVCV